MTACNSQNLTLFGSLSFSGRGACVCKHTERDIEREEEQREVDNQQSERGVHIASIISNDFQTFI